MAAKRKNKNRRPQQNGGAKRKGVSKVTETKPDPEEQEKLDQQEAADTVAAENKAKADQEAKDTQIEQDRVAKEKEVQAEQDRLKQEQADAEKAEQEEKRLADGKAIADKKRLDEEEAAKEDEKAAQLKLDEEAAAEKKAAGDSPAERFDACLKDRADLFANGGAINKKPELESNMADLLITAHSGSSEVVDAFVNYLQKKGHENTGFGTVLVSRGLSGPLQKSLGATFAICVRLADTRKAGSTLSMNEALLKEILSPVVVTYLRNG